MGRDGELIELRADRVVDVEAGQVRPGRVVLVRGERIEAVLHPGQPVPEGATLVDLPGHTLLPGLIDCHTHLVFGGNRAGEFERRLEGASYEAIARAGGGIRSTVKATRLASLEELVEQARPRLKALMRGGVTTVEIKSGYGLDVPSEMKLL
jgi:imidazolonepropionase